MWFEIKFKVMPLDYSYYGRKNYYDSGEKNYRGLSIIKNQFIEKLRKYE